jgi:hypothetical protein
MRSLAVEAFAGELRDAIVCTVCLGAILRAAFPSARICVFPAHLVLKCRGLPLDIDVSSRSHSSLPSNSTWGNPGPSRDSGSI